MTTHAEWQKDRKAFLTLLTDTPDTDTPVPLAIRIDLPRHYSAVMAPGVTDWDELRLACSQWVENWLAPEMSRMDAHLAWKAELARLDAHLAWKAGQK